MDTTVEHAPRLMTIPEVCESLRVGRTTVYRLVGEGRLTFIHLGRSVRVRATDVQELIDELAAEAAAA